MCVCVSVLEKTGDRKAQLEARRERQREEDIRGKYLVGWMEGETMTQRQNTHKGCSIDLEEQTSI